MIPTLIEALNNLLNTHIPFGSQIRANNIARPIDPMRAVHPYHTLLILLVILTNHIIYFGMNFLDPDL